MTRRHKKDKPHYEHPPACARTKFSGKAKVAINDMEVEQKQYDEGTKISRQKPTKLPK